MNRLEEIKGYYQRYDANFGLSGEQIDWLIEQAERVEELEEENKRLDRIINRASERNIGYIEQNQRYKQALEEIRDSVTWDNAEDATYNAYQEASKALEESE